MATRTLGSLHLTPLAASGRGFPARRAGDVVNGLALGGALLAGGAVVVVLLSLLLVVCAPLGAGLAAWLLWRSGDGAAREARRVRVRLRRRARALGLVVLAGSRPAVLRLAQARRGAPTRA